MKKLVSMYQKYMFHPILYKSVTRVSVVAVLMLLWDQMCIRDSDEAVELVDADLLCKAGNIGAEIQLDDCLLYTSSSGPFAEQGPHPKEEASSPRSAGGAGDPGAGGVRCGVVSHGRRSRRPAPAPEDPASAYRFC